MNPGIKKLIKKLSAGLVVLALFQTATIAAPLVIPGFFGIESPYIEATESDMGNANIYFSITNLHAEPILILSASGELFGDATLKNSNNETLEYIEVQPRERVVLEPGGMHIQLNDVESAVHAGDVHEISILFRRGLEAEEYVEEFFDNSIREFKGGGIPNEKEYVLHIPIQ